MQNARITMQSVKSGIWRERSHTQEYMLYDSTHTGCAVWIQEWAKQMYGNRNKKHGCIKKINSLGINWTKEVKDMLKKCWFQVRGKLLVPWFCDHAPKLSWLFYSMSKIDRNQGVFRCAKLVCCARHNLPCGKRTFQERIIDARTEILLSFSCTSHTCLVNTHMHSFCIGKKKSKFKTFKKFFGKKKRKESPSSTGSSTWKQSQAKNEVIAIESGPVGYDSEDELE